MARELFDLFAKIYKVRGSECQNNNSEKHCRTSYRVHISHKLMHYSEKMSPRRLIRSRSNARKCSRHVVHRASKFSIFLLLFLSSIFFFFLLLLHHPHQVPLGLSCITSPKCTALCDGITLHDGWIWVKLPSERDILLMC